MHNFLLHFPASGECRLKEPSMWMLQQQFNEHSFKIKTHLALKACSELILHGLQLGV